MMLLRTAMTMRCRCYHAAAQIYSHYSTVAMTLLRRGTMCAMQIPRHSFARALTLLRLAANRFCAGVQMLLRMCPESVLHLHLHS
jgi:hypothetical protein